MNKSIKNNVIVALGLLIIVLTISISIKYNEKSYAYVPKESEWHIRLLNPKITENTTIDLEDITAPRISDRTNISIGANIIPNDKLDFVVDIANSGKSVGLLKSLNTKVFKNNIEIDNKALFDIKVTWEDGKFLIKNEEVSTNEKRKIHVTIAPKDDLIEENFYNFEIGLDFSEK